MKRHAAVAVLLSIAVAPLLAQVPKGWMVRVDRSTEASDPDAPGAPKLVPTASGFHVTAPQSAVLWNSANTATGNYTLKGTFTLNKSTGYLEYYGLIFGGSNIEGAGQQYLYFVITDDGTWLVKRRTGGTTQEVSDKTPSTAVKKPDAKGTCTNTLEVRVMADKIDFVVNGTVVKTLPKTGPAAKTDGVYGMRINHHLEVQVDGLGVSKNPS
jgi:subtilisin-like proprotein convertase family protein